MEKKIGAHNAEFYIINALGGCPNGMRKREISSVTHIWVGDLIKPIARLEAQGLIAHRTYRDMANMEFYDIYFLVK